MNHFLLVGLFSTNISNFDTIFLLFLPITERMVLKSPNIIVVSSTFPFSPLSITFTHLEALLWVLTYLGMLHFLNELFFFYHLILRSEERRVGKEC